MAQRDSNRLLATFLPHIRQERYYLFLKVIVNIYQYISKPIGSLILILGLWTIAKPYTNYSPQYPGKSGKIDKDSSFSIDPRTITLAFAYHQYYSLV